MTMALQPSHQWPSLPFDILVAIIGELVDSRDTNSLRSCSLLCRHLLHPCRRALFRTFDMRDISGNALYFLKFNTLLSNNAHLIPYVRNVHLLDVHDYREKEHKSPFFLNEHIPSFLHMLTNVETFGLHSARWTHWHELGPDAQSGIMQIITRPCCVELHLENVRNIVPSLLNSCRSLKIWEIGGCFLEGFEDRQSSTEQMEVDVRNDYCIYLDSVSFNTASPELLFDLDPCSSNSPLLLRFSRLRHLTITMSPETIEAMWKLIHYASDTLRTLTLCQRAETSDRSASVSGSDSEFVYRHAPLTMGRKSQILRDPHMNLSPMTHLYRFSFTVILQVIAEDFPRDRLYDWCVLLRTSPPSIREVNITLDLFYCQPEEIIVIFSPSSSAEDGTETSGGDFLVDLDYTLSDCPVFPSLKNVEITVLLSDDYAYTTDSEYFSETEDGEPYPPVMEIKEIEDAVKERMPLTRASLDDGVWIRARTGHHN